MTRKRADDTEILEPLSELACFHVVGELNSFRAAATRLKLSPQTLKRRVTSLEARAGVALFKRTQVGALLTVEGQALYRDLDDFWRVSAAAVKKISEAGGAPRGEVVISINEGLGTFWLCPRFANFLGRNTELTVYVRADAEVGNPERGDCDVSISLNRPDTPNLIARRLGYLHVMPFASDEYIEAHGAPTSIEELHQHRIVEQTNEQFGFDAGDHPAADDAARLAAAVRTNTSAAHFWSIAKGAGIGLLPTYYRAISRRIQPIDIGFRLRREIWLSFSKGSREIGRINAALDFITLCFSAQQFPWFGAEFIHPRDLDRWFEENDLEKRFEQFLDHCVDLEEKTTPSSEES